MPHPLLDPAIVAAVERAASVHRRGADWIGRGFTDLAVRASHPAGIFLGEPFSVFAKLSTSATGPEQFTAELDGLSLIGRRAGVRTPVPVASGVIRVPAGCLLLSEALPERAGTRRTRQDFLGIGTALARLHQVHDDEFGLRNTDGFFGPLPQDNRPVAGNNWPGFYAERRVWPMLRLARDSGNFPAELVTGAERVLARLPDLAGPDPVPSLLHGDAQQNNFLCLAGQVPGDSVVIDAAPYFGHPEIDLALLGYFEPVPQAVFDGYREIGPIDSGFADRRELWRVFAYLAVIACTGAQNATGIEFTARLAAAVRRYR